MNASIVVGLVDEIKDHRRGFKPFAPVIDGPNTVRFRQSINQSLNEWIDCRGSSLSNSA